jgi:hypothetical protein
MNKLVITPFNVVDKAKLPEMVVDRRPSDGDPLEINGELYYVCENISLQQADSPMIGVIPLVVRNPSKVTDIEKYIECLSLAHRKVLFKNAKGICNLTNCDEMIIS